MSTAAPPAIQRLPARLNVMGGNMPAARLLPHRDRAMVGPWCFIDHIGPVHFAPGQGWHAGAHPHMGLQAFTWMLEGRVVYRDALGHKQTVRPSQLNLMTAGRGMAHAEDSAQDGAPLHAVQLWAALPDALRECEPTFEHHAQLPLLTAGGFQLSVLTGSLLGQISPMRLHSPALAFELRCQSAAYIHLPLDADFEHAALVLQGQARVAGQALAPHELLYFPPGHTALDVACTQGARLLLLGGAPFAQPVTVWWNFVGHDHAHFQQALNDWNERPASGGRFGHVPTRRRRSAPDRPAPPHRA